MLPHLENSKYPLATREQERESDQTQDDSLQQYGHLKRAFFREQRSRIRDGRRVDTTAGLARAQTTLRQWRAPHTLPSRAPYGHGALLRRAVGGTSTPGEVCMVAPSPQDCGHDTDRPPADADLKAHLPHPCAVQETTSLFALLWRARMTRHPHAASHVPSDTAGEHDNPTPVLVRPRGRAPTSESGVREHTPHSRCSSRTTRTRTKIKHTQMTTKAAFFWSHSAELRRTRSSRFQSR